VPVLLACQMLEGGGSEHQMREMAMALDRSLFVPHVACFRNDAGRQDALNARGIPVLEIPIRSFRSLGAFTGANLLRQYLRRHHIQVFHSFDTPFHCFGLPVARMAGVRVVLGSQRAHRSLYSAFYRRWLRFSDRFADGIVVNSETLREHLVDDEGVPARKIHLIHNGINATRFRFRQRPHGATLTIGCVCRFRPEKDLPTLLRAFALLKQSSVRLLLVGGGPAQEALGDLARELGIADRVEFRPVTLDVPAALGEIDIFVLPSLTEGLSNSLMEAMARGCTVVASAVGGNLELVRPGVTGLLFPARDVRKLRDQMARLLDAPEEREQLAAAGAAWIRSNFSMEAAARSLEQLYRQTLSVGN